MANERLHPVPKPAALVHLFETQMPLTPDGITVERYTTANHYIFERHIAPSGVEHWFLVTERNELPEV